MVKLTREQIQYVLAVAESLGTPDNYVNIDNLGKALDPEYQKHKDAFFKSLLSKVAKEMDNEKSL